MLVKIITGGAKCRQLAVLGPKKAAEIFFAIACGTRPLPERSSVPGGGGETIDSPSPAIYTLMIVGLGKWARQTAVDKKRRLPAKLVSAREPSVLAGVRKIYGRSGSTFGRL